jgi:hypothetical protein
MPILERLMPCRTSDNLMENSLLGHQKWHFPGSLESASHKIKA